VSVRHAAAVPEPDGADRLEAVLSASRVSRPDLGAFLDEVYPVLFDRLDAAFPEFGWQRKGDAWVGSRWPSSLSLAADDKRGDRLQVYRDRPHYLKLHGHQGQTLLSYVAGEQKPRGETFVDAVRKIATLAGVPFPESDPSPAQVARSVALEERRRALEATADACALALASNHPTAVAARAFLRDERGFLDAEVTSLGLGVYLDRRAVSQALDLHGVDPAAARDAGVLWQKLEGYVVIPWRDAAGRVLTLYGRWHQKKPTDGRPKTIALPGADTKGVPLYLDEARRAKVEELVLVEGVLDAALLQARGDRRVIASVSAQLSGNQVQSLQRHGVRRVIVCGDPDGGGDRGNEANVRLLLNAGIGALVAPRLPDNLDPDELVKRDGLDVWKAHVARAVTGPRFLVERALAGAKREDEDAARRAAFDRVVAALGTCPSGPDDGAAVGLAASVTGYPRRVLEIELRSARAKARKAPAPAKNDPKPTIRVRPELEDVVLEAEDALVAANVGVYQRGGALVHVARDASGPRIVPLPKAALNVLLAQHAVWVSPKRMPNGDMVDVRILPPRAVVDGLFERNTWRLPELEAIVVSPVLRQDGTVLDAPGYDASTRLIYEPTAAFPPVPEHPTRDDALAALAALVEPLEDFPFVDAHDESAAVALVLTALGRSAFSGAAPLFLVRATVAGTGKQLLANVVASIATGSSEPPSFAAPREDAEWTKTIASHVRDAARFVLIDEARDLRSPALASLVTRERMAERLLGTNQLVRGQLPVLCAAGNNTTISDDMGRRIIPIRLDAGVERPEHRGGFKIPRLLAWCQQHRPRLVVAALTVLRAFLAAGSPGGGLTPLGSFEEWSALVRSALVWLDAPDPASRQEALREEADVGADDTLALLRAWHTTLGEASYSARELVDRAQGPSEFRELLLALDPKDRESLNSRRLGYSLRRLKGRPIGGLKLVSEGRTGNERGVGWRVVRTTTETPDRPHRPHIVRSIVRTQTLIDTSSSSFRNDENDKTDTRGAESSARASNPIALARHARGTDGALLSSASFRNPTESLCHNDIRADDQVAVIVPERPERVPHYPRPGDGEGVPSEDPDYGDATEPPDDLV
jgi:hypothetical protein